MAGAALPTARSTAPSVPIAHVARRLGVSHRTLRHYQDLGLIKSHRIARNTRAYDVATVAIIETIVALREVGLPLSAIGEILNADLECHDATLRRALSLVRADLLQQIGKLDLFLSALATPAKRRTAHPPSFDSTLDPERAGGPNP